MNRRLEFDKKARKLEKKLLSIFKILLYILGCGVLCQIMLWLWPHGHLYEIGSGPLVFDMLAKATNYYFSGNIFFVMFLTLVLVFVIVFAIKAPKKYEMKNKNRKDFLKGGTTIPRYVCLVETIIFGIIYIIMRKETWDVWLFLMFIVVFFAFLLSNVMNAKKVLCYDLRTFFINNIVIVMLLSVVLFYYLEPFSIIVAVSIIGNIILSILGKMPIIFFF